MEVGDTGIEVPIGIVAADWDNVDHVALTAKIYPTFTDLADGDAFHLYWDPSHDDNANVTELGSAPAAPGGGDALTVWNLAATDDLWDIATALIAVRAILSMPYALEGTLRNLVDQLFHLTTPFIATCDHVYGIRLLAALVQRYGDVPQLRAILDQVYGSAAVLRRICRQDYGDALRLVAELDQRWSQYADLRALVHQKYSISGEELRRILSQNYDLRQYADLRAVLDQVYVVAPGTAIEQRPEVSVTSAGLTLSPHHISIEVDEGSYFVAGEIHLSDEAEFLQLAHLQEVAVRIDDTTFDLIANLPRGSRPEVGREDFVMPLASPAILLDAPYAEALTREFNSAMASAIAAEMAATASISIDWRLVDWYIPGSTLYANGETPLAIIRKLVEAVGGLLQSAPDGTLICRPEYPHSLPERETATPDFSLTDQDNFFSVDSSPEVRDGFNKFLISNQGEAAADSGLTLEQRDIDEQTKEVLVYRVPWTGQAISLRTSGGGWVGIVDEGVATEILVETVEIVSGEGRVTKPLYEKLGHQYKQASLGAITPSEDGHLSSETPGNSLVEVTYQTKYHLFRVSSDRIEDVQFYPEELS
jgi:hypothetical protein